MALEHENRIHAAMGLAFEPGKMIVRVCRGVLLSTIEQIAPGVIECELVDGLGDGEAILTTSVGVPPAPFIVATVIHDRLSDTRWRFRTFRAEAVQDFGPCDFDVVWYRPATGAGPVAVIPVP